MSEEIGSIESQLFVGLEARIDIWNGLLAAAENDEQRKFTIEQAVEELDYLACEKFGIELGQRCAVSGSAIWCEMDYKSVEDGVGTNTVDKKSKVLGEYSEHNGDVAGKTAVFNGFENFKPDEDERSEFWYAFAIKTHKHRAHRLTANMQIDLMYVDPKTAVITPADRFEEPYLEQDPEVRVLEDSMERALELARRSMAFAQLLDSEDFRQLSLDQQAADIGFIIKETEKVTGIRVSSATVKAERGYINEPDAENGEVTRTAIDLSGLTLQGLCLALAMTKQDNNKGTAGSKNIEGLCLTIELDETSDLPDNMKPGSLLDIPISGQPLLMGFYTKPT